MNSRILNKDNTYFYLKNLRKSCHGKMCLQRLKPKYLAKKSSISGN